MSSGRHVPRGGGSGGSGGPVLSPAPQLSPTAASSRGAAASSPRASPANNAKNRVTLPRVDLARFIVQEKFETWQTSLWLLMLVFTIWIVIHFVQFSNLSRDSELDMVLKAFVDDVQGPETGIAFADIRTAADMQDFVVGLVQALYDGPTTQSQPGVQYNGSIIETKMTPFSTFNFPLVLRLASVPSIPTTVEFAQLVTRTSRHRDEDTEFVIPRLAETCPSLHGLPDGNWTGTLQDLHRDFGEHSCALAMIASVMPRQAAVEAVHGLVKDEFFKPSDEVWVFMLSSFNAPLEMVSALSALVFVSESGVVRRQVRVASLGDWAVNYVGLMRLVDIANVVVVLMWMLGKVRMSYMKHTTLYRHKLSSTQSGRRIGHRRCYVCSESHTCGRVGRACWRPLDFILLIATGYMAVRSISFTIDFDSLVSRYSGNMVAGKAFMMRYAQYKEYLDFLSYMLSAELGRWLSLVEMFAARISRLTHENGVYMLIVNAVVLKDVPYSSRLSLLRTMFKHQTFDFGPVVLLMVLISVSYAVAGMQLFGAWVPQFATLGSALLTCFEMTYGEGVSAQELADLTAENGNSVGADRNVWLNIYPYIYYISYVVVQSFVVLNVFVAIAVTSYEAFSERMMALRRKTFMASTARGVVHRARKLHGTVVAAPQACANRCCCHRGPPGPRRLGPEGRTRHLSSHPSQFGVDAATAARNELEMWEQRTYRMSVLLDAISQSSSIRVSEDAVMARAWRIVTAKLGMGGPRSKKFSKQTALLRVAIRSRIEDVFDAVAYELGLGSADMRAWRTLPEAQQQQQDAQASKRRGAGAGPGAGAGAGSGAGGTDSWHRGDSFDNKDDAELRDDDKSKVNPMWQHAS